MGEEPKLTCAGDSQMKTIRFRVVLGALNLKEPSPLLKVFGHLRVRDSCPPQSYRWPARFAEAPHIAALKFSKIPDVKTE